MPTILKMMLPMLIHALREYVEKHNPDATTTVVCDNLEQAANAALNYIK